MAASAPQVIVIGAGIGGLCLAQGLTSAGIPVAVYERDCAPDARLQGYRLNIEPMGSRALHACLPAHLWQILVATAGDPGRGMGVFTESLHELMREDDVAAADPANATHAVSRITLRRVLLAGLADSVHFGKEFVGYQRTTDGRVTASFADGTSAHGDLLVGADGFRSRVRQGLLPDAASIDAPGVGIGGKLPLTAQTMAWLPPDLLGGKSMILPRQDFLFTAVFRRRPDPERVLSKVTEELAAAGLDGQQLLRDATDEDYLLWAYVAHRDVFGADLVGAGGKALRTMVAGRMTGWQPSLRRVIDDTAPEVVQRFDFAAANRPEPWETGNVTLLGDAIHYMPPVGGLGGNAALHDANLLCQALRRVHHGAAELLPALREYENQMLGAGFASVNTALRYLKLATARSHLLRRTARGFFRSCGTIGPLRRAVFQD